MSKTKSPVDAPRKKAGRPTKRVNGAVMTFQLSADVREHIKARALARNESPADYIEREERAKMGAKGNE